jgi:O-antigen/teichoic acid export membrane protein
LVAAAMAGYLLINELAMVPNALLQRRFSYVRRVVLAPAVALVTGGVAIAALASGLGTWAFVIGAYAGAVTDTTLSWLFVRWSPCFADVRYSTWRELARYGRHVLASGAMTRADYDGRTAIVGHFLGTASVGAYALAYRLALQPLALLKNGFSYVLFPALTRIADDPDRLRGASIRTLRWSTTAAFPMVAILVALAHPAVALVFGSRWHEAATALRWMALYAGGGVVLSVAAETWKAVGEPKWLARSTALAAGTTLAFTAALLPFGVAGPAAAVTIGTTVAAAYALFVLARTIGVSVWRLVQVLVAPTISAAAAGIAAGALVSMTDPAGQTTGDGIALLAVCGLVGLAVYGLLIAVKEAGSIVLSARQLAVATGLRRAAWRP